MSIFDQIKKAGETIKGLFNRAIGKKDEADVSRVARYLNVDLDTARELPRREFEAILQKLKGIEGSREKRSETPKQRRARLRLIRREKRIKAERMKAFLRQARKDAHKAYLEWRKKARLPEGTAVNFDRMHERIRRGADGKFETITVHREPDTYIVAHHGNWLRKDTARNLYAIREANGGQTEAPIDKPEKVKARPGRLKREADRRRMRDFNEWQYRQRMDALFDLLDGEAA